MRIWLSLAIMAPLAACQGPSPAAGGNDAAPANQVATSGKTEVALTEVPPAVLAVATEARAGFVPSAAEAETRDGRDYFDIEGRLPDGAEIEFDIMAENGGWRVVETQRDIEFAATPEPVRAAALAQDASLTPSRVIESVQADGLTIYELYTTRERKLEVKWDGKSARVLTEEWAH